MRAVTYHGAGDIRVEDRPEPELEAGDSCVVRVEASGVCGSDLHIFHGRVPIEAGFTVGHEFVGSVVAAGPDVAHVSEGDRVVGCFATACGSCFYCLRSAYHKCSHSRTFGHGTKLGDLQGAQAEMLMVPNANLTLRRVPESIDDGAALFAGDVMATAYHAVSATGLAPGDTFAVIGLGPVGLCAVQVARAAGAAEVIAIDMVADRLAVAESFGATAVHLTEQDPKAAVRAATEGRGADVVAECVGRADALDLALRLVRDAGTVSVTGQHSERIEVHMGLAWIKGLTLVTGPANVIGHVDRVLAMLDSGVLDPSPLVTHRMPLEEAPQAYEIFDRREALKIVLSP